MANLVLRHEANLSKIKQMWHLRMVCSKFAIEVDPFFSSSVIFGILRYLKALYEIRGKRRIHGKSLLAKVDPIAQMSKFVHQRCNFHSLQVIIGEFFLAK